MQLGMEKLTINYSNAATPPTNRNRTVKTHRSRRSWVCQSYPIFCPEQLQLAFNGRTDLIGGMAMTS